MIIDIIIIYILLIIGSYFLIVILILGEGLTTVGPAIFILL